MTKEIRTAIIGCGKVGDTHAQAYHQLKNASLAAVCDRNEKAASALAEKYGARAYTDAEAMFAENRLDAVSICTPHPTHRALIEIAASRGAHVLTEKPLASDLQDCDQAIAACEENGVKLSVVSQRRFYRPILRMREAIAQGKIGQPIIGNVIVLGWRSPEYYQMDAWRGTWDQEGGGVMVNQTIHQLDLLQWLMGDIDFLFGLWDNFNHPTIDVEDTAAAVIRFKSGAIGQFLVSNSQKPGFYGKIHIHGSNGASVGAQPEGGSPFVAGVTSDVEPPINDMWTIPGEEALLGEFQEADRRFARENNPMLYYHTLQIQDFLKAISEDCPPAITGQDGRRAVEIFTAVYRSQRDRQPIAFPLSPEPDRDDFDGRLTFRSYAHQTN
jgi:predicted dehydrogenase